MQVVLERTMTTVASGRARLQGADRRDAEPAPAPVEPDTPAGFFDQDE